MPPVLQAEGSLTQSYNISEQPVSLVVDSNYDGNEIYGVDTTEQSVANAASGEARKNMHLLMPVGLVLQHMLTITEV